jgi:hypothetical protein
MAQSGRATACETLPAVVRQANQERWSAPRAAILVTGVSLALWAVILAGLRWLIG